MPTYSYVPVTNTGGPIGTQWLTGGTRFFTFDTQDGAYSCDDARAYFLTLTPAQQLVLTSPAPPDTSDPDGKDWVDWDCVSADNWPTRASIDNSLYEPPESNNPPDPTPTPGATVPTTNQVAGMNPDVFTPVVQWQNGKARIANGVNPPGGTIQYYFAGQPPVTALPTSYDYAPGDDVMLILAVSNSPYVYQSAWTQKAMVNVKIGPAPN